MQVQFNERAAALGALLYDMPEPKSSNEPRCTQLEGCLQVLFEINLALMDQRGVDDMPELQRPYSNVRFDWRERMISDELLATFQSQPVVRYDSLSIVVRLCLLDMVPDSRIHSDTARPLETIAFACHARKTASTTW